MHPKRRRESVNLSPVTPNCDDKPCGPVSKTPSVKVMGRFTRSMVVKTNAVKPSEKNIEDIETVVLDEEENGTVQHNGPDINPNPVTNPIEHDPHISDKDPQVDSAPNPQTKDKLVEGNLLGSYRISEAVHPLFVNCLLDKIRRMEL